MIRFAHPFGAILRMFSALRATSSFRWDDAWGISGDWNNLKFGALSPILSRRPKARKKKATTNGLEAIEKQLPPTRFSETPIT